MAMRKGSVIVLRTIRMSPVRWARRYTDHSCLGLDVSGHHRTGTDLRAGGYAPILEDLCARTDETESAMSTPPETFTPGFNTFHEPMRAS